MKEKKKGKKLNGWADEDQLMSLKQEPLGCRPEERQGPHFRNGLNWMPFRGLQLVGYVGTAANS